MSNIIAVTGATGQFGTIAINLLKAKGASVVALARSPEKVQGVEARKFDYSQPNVEALQGVDTLILVSGSEIGQREVQHKNVINVAKAAGVKRIIYTSLLGATNENTVKGLAGEHVATENALKASGLVYTVLRNGWYTENYTASVQPAIQNGAFYGSAKDGKISSATRADLAEAAVNVALSGEYQNEIVELAGSEAWTLADLAAEISRQTGKQIPYVDLSVADYAAGLEKAGLPAPVALFYAECDADAANGALFSEDKTLEKILGRKTTSLADAVKAAL